MAPLGPNLDVFAQPPQAKLPDPLFFLLGRVHVSVHEQCDAQLTGLDQGVEGWRQILDG